jgi:hypothetical protein
MLSLALCPLKEGELITKKKKKEEEELGEVGETAEETDGSRRPEKLPAPAGRVRHQFADSSPSSVPGELFSARHHGCSVFLELLIICGEV